jgi:thiamine biosynthesis lipoprotein
LGGIAKGYACDRAVEILTSHRVKHALLDFGGNIYALGTKPDGEKWRVGIRNPVLGEDGYICVVEVADKTVVTSGGYERYFEHDGKTYSHILDPATGYPAENGLLSVSIVAGNSTDADALSTACYVLGLEAGLALLDSLPDCDGVFVTDEREVYVTGGLTGGVAISDARFVLS